MACAASVIQNRLGMATIAYHRSRWQCCRASVTATLLSSMKTRKKTEDAYAYRSELPFVKRHDGDRGILWWSVKPTGRWVEDFALGRRHALKFWEVCGSGRAFALEFQQIILGMLTAARSPTGPTAYSGIEAGFLLTIGELSGGVPHIQELLQNHDTRRRWTRVVNEIAAGRYTPDEWEFGVSHNPSRDPSPHTDRRDDDPA